MDNRLDNLKDVYNSDDVPVGEKKNKYTLVHAIFAVFALIIGSLWFRWLFMNSVDALFGSYNGVWVTLFTVVFTAFSVSFFYIRKAEFNKDALFMLIFALIVSLRFTLFYRDANSEMFLLSIFVLHVAMLLFLRCIGSGNSLDKVIGETAYSVFVDPYLSFHTVFASMSAFFKKGNNGETDSEKNKKAFRQLGFVALGIVIAVPIVLVVFSLLSSDPFFMGIINAIDDFFGGISYDLNVFEFVNPSTILVSMFIYGAVFTADKKRTEEKRTPNNWQCAPVTVIKTVLASLLVVYLLFVIAQITGFYAMFRLTLPEGHTYASFARSGFFELCIAACINGAVLFYSHILAERKDGEKQGTWLKYLLVGFTLFLIATAAAKMCMYVSVYGFTSKRFYTLWFMLLLAILFVMTLFKLKNNAFKLSRYSTYVTCAMLVLLFLVDFQGIAAHLNNMYFIR